MYYQYYYAELFVCVQEMMHEKLLAMTVMITMVTGINKGMGLLKYAAETLKTLWSRNEWEIEMRCPK